MTTWKDNLVLQKALFCFTLKTGNIVIGSIEMAGALIKIILVALGLVAIKYVQKEHQKEHPEDTESDTAFAFATGIVIFTMVIMAFAFLISLFLVIGAARSKLGLVKFVLGWKIFLLVCIFISLLMSFTSGASAIVQNIIYFIVEFYVMCCVFSLKRELDATGGRIAVNQFSPKV